MRFPGFEGEWEVRKLGEVANISSGGTPSRSNPLFWNGNIPWISTTLIDFNYINKSEEYITEEGLKNSSAKLFPIGTLLMAMYGQGKTRGKISILNIEATTNQACGAIITNKEILNSLFAFQNLAKRYDEIRDLSNQGGQENLSGGIIKEIEISFPTLFEQEKIVSFLSRIDERIQTQNKIIEELITLKTTIIHKIFSQQLRFQDKNGKEFYDWEIKKLGDLVEFFKGSSLSKGDISTEGKIKCIHYGELFTVYNEVILSVISRTNKIGFYSKKGDVLMPSSDVTPIGLATASTILENGVILGGDINVLRPSVEINSIFLSYLINYEKKKIIELVSGTTIKHIYSKDLKAINLSIPNSVYEQTKIANFLSSIDEKIEIERRILEQYKTQKKYLLSNLFI